MNAVDRSRHAEQLLGDEVLQDAFAEVERLFVKQWREGQNPMIREAAWHQLHALGELQRVLRSVVDRGKVEAVTSARKRD